jgi:sugar/nucleoside kinase (ribokinase family)
LAIAGCTRLDQALDRLGGVVATVAVKRGAEGAVCRQSGQTVSDPGFHLEVVDTTGAGDSFNAGFLYGVLNGWAPARSLALGCACGALSTQAAGGTAAQPTLAEAQALVQRRV